MKARVFVETKGADRTHRNKIGWAERYQNGDIRITLEAFPVNGSLYIPSADAALLVKGSDS